jgi:hypothetical protein
MMELLLCGFGIGGLGAKLFTEGTQGVEPEGVFGGKLLFEFFAEALGKRGAFAVSGDGDLEVATLDDGAVVEVAVVNIVDGVAEDIAFVGFEKDGCVHLRKRGGGDTEEDALKIFRFEGFY